MTNPYTQKCRAIRCTRLVEVIEDEDGPWTSGYCGYHNDRMAEHERERQEFLHYHHSPTEDRK